MNRLPVVAVLGLGAMGHAFAANLVKKNFTVRGWNRTRERGEDLAAAGMTLCDSPPQAAGDADVVIVMLTDAAATEAVITGKGGILAGLKPGAIVAQMGTIGVESTDRLYKAVATARPDVVFVDAPVSGTKAPAENAQITVLAGGDRARRRRRAGIRRHRQGHSMAGRSRCRLAHETGGQRLADFHDAGDGGER